MAFSMAWGEGAVEDGAEERGVLAAFRAELRRCLSRRGDALFDLADAVLCAEGPVRDVAGLSLVPACRRGHGALYDGLNAGRVQVTRLRRALAGLRLPAWDDGRIRLAVDVSNWLRPEAVTSPERLFCHVHGRGGNAGQMIPGWPYSLVVALEPGATSWTMPLDAVRLGPDDDETEVTAAQVREVIRRLADAGHWREGDEPVIVVFDAGYDLTRLAYLLAGLPVQVTGRLRGDRVLCCAPPPRNPRTPGRAPRHGAVVKLADPAACPGPAVTTTTATTRYGTVQARAWDRMHARLTRRGGWENHAGDLPVIEGTLIQLCAEHLRGRPRPRPMWLWASLTGASAADITRLWQAFLRRFDIEHNAVALIMRRGERARWWVVVTGLGLSA